MATRDGADVIRRSFERPTIRLDEQSLKNLVSLAELEGVELVDWQTKGIPVPDGSWGVWRVSPAVSEEVFKILFELQHPHWWFPRGIPVIDHFEVHTTNVAVNEF